MNDLITLVNSLAFVTRIAGEVRKQLTDETDYSTAMALDLAATHLDKAARSINWRIEAIEIAKAAQE